MITSVKLHNKYLALPVSIKKPVRQKIFEGFSTIIVHVDQLQIWRNDSSK
jgi:hypothetical protein